MELSNEKYMGNINTVYNALCDNKEFDTVEPMASIPASVKLTESGNILYVENGKLRVLPIRHSKAIKSYCERNNLVMPSAVVEETATEKVSEEAVVASNLVAEI